MAKTDPRQPVHDSPLYGETLGTIRHRHGLTQEQLSELSGVSVNRIAAYEREGGARPRLANARALARIFGLPVDAIRWNPKRERGARSRLPEAEQSLLPDGHCTLRAWRLQTHRSAAEVARLLGVHQTAVSGWENGYNHPRGHTRLKLCRLMGVRPDQLVWPLRASESLTESVTCPEDTSLSRKLQTA